MLAQPVEEQYEHEDGGSQHHAGEPRTAEQANRPRDRRDRPPLGEVQRVFGTRWKARAFSTVSRKGPTPHTKRGDEAVAVTATSGTSADRPLSAIRAKQLA